MPQADKDKQNLETNAPTEADKNQREGESVWSSLEGWGVLILYLFGLILLGSIAVIIVVGLCLAPTQPLTVGSLLTFCFFYWLFNSK
jgi:hypothetical protein